MSTSAEEASIHAVSPELSSGVVALCAGEGLEEAGVAGCADGACANAVDVTRSRQTAAPKHRKIVLIAFSSSAQTEPI
jgi:hypothetical protein